jgi:predicted N-acetyltransferase YhbS
MRLELVPAEPQHVDAIGQICFEAFKEVQEGHGFPPDLPSIEVARQVLGMMVQREDFYGVVALQDGQPVGSNFLSLMDPVAGVGPITVDCSSQGQGIGRALMQDVIDYARRNNIEQVRLLQDSFNVTSLSLYASLGFNVKEAVAFMQAAPAAEADLSIRPVTEADLPAIEELSKRIYKNSRRNEVVAAAPYGFAALLREHQGRITGYLIPGIFGHGIALPSGDGLGLEVVLTAGFCQAGGPTNQLQYHSGLEFRGKSATNCHVLALLLDIITSLSQVSKIRGALQTLNE